MMETYRLTPRQIHEEVNKWSAYERMAGDKFWSAEVLEITGPVLMAAVTDVLCRFLIDHGYAQEPSS